MRTSLEGVVYRKEHKNVQVAEQSQREFKVGDIVAHWGIDGNNPIER